MVGEVATGKGAIGFLTPIAVGAYGIGFYGGGAGYEDVIYATSGELVGFVAVEGAVFCPALFGTGVGVLEKSRLCEDGVDFIFLRDIEITGENGQFLAVGSHLGDALHDEFCRLAASFHANVVHVEVEEIEVAIGLKVDEMAPCADADAGCVPTKCGSVGSLVEPEIAVFNELYTFGIIEDGSVFASLFAIIAPNAYPSVAAKTCFEVHHLCVEDFLSAEDVGLLPSDLLTDGLAAAVPVVALDAVLTILVADIVAAYGEGLSRCSKSDEDADERANEVFHD